MFESRRVIPLLSLPVLLLSPGRPADALEPPPVFFLRGDPNADGAVDLSDAVSILLRLFLGGEETTCRSAADTNDDGAVDVSDPVTLLNALFLGGPPPGEPYPVCGPDRSSGLG